MKLAAMCVPYRATSVGCRASACHGSIPLRAPTEEALGSCAGTSATHTVAQASPAADHTPKHPARPYACRMDSDSAKPLAVPTAVPRLIEEVTARERVSGVAHVYSSRYVHGKMHA